MLDLSIRRFPAAHLKLNQDLLEVININNGISDFDNNDYYLLEHNVYPKSIIAVKHPNYWGGTYGSYTAARKYDEAVVTVTGMWGYSDFDYPRTSWVNTDEVVVVQFLHLITLY